MSSISAVGAAQSYIPPVQTNKTAPTQQSAAPVSPVARDSDGDNDGSKGGKIDVFA